MTRATQMTNTAELMQVYVCGAFQPTWNQLIS